MTVLHTYLCEISISSSTVWMCWFFARNHGKKGCSHTTMRARVSILYSAKMAVHVRFDRLFLQDSGYDAGK